MKPEKEMTALVRLENGNLKVIRANDYNRQKDFADDLRGNGFRILKIWAGYRPEEEINEWEFLNRS